MKVLKLIQVGDVHYPQHRNEAELIDLKDGATNPALVSATAPSPLVSAIRELVYFCEDNVNKIGGILICGDLTSWGDLNAYSECAEWLRSSLGPPRFTEAQLHAVPGNHDIDRSKCDPAGLDLLLKFQPLLDTWANLGISVLAAKGIRQTEVTENHCTAAIFSLNSCLGCQERRKLPEGIREGLHKLLESYVSNTGLEKAFDLVGEQMDTPAFSEHDIDQTVRNIRALSPDVMPVVLAHHNLLPQAQPRIALYTEVLNSGLVRSRFSRCPRPLIYCHGHIHDDPVEIVQQPASASGKLISIAAPEFVQGFNVIEIHYANVGRPIGCVLVPYRRQNHLGIEPQAAIRIPLMTIRDYVEVADPLLSKLMPIIGIEPIRFKDLLDGLRIATGTQHQLATLQDALLEAEWFGLIMIHNRENPPKHWQIRRTAP